VSGSAAWSPGAVTAGSGNVVLGSTAVVTPHQAHQLRPAEHDSRVLGEHTEQVELAFGQVDSVSADVGTAPRQVDLQGSDADDACRGRCAGCPPQQRAQPRHQLAQLERLGQVVVRASLQSRDPVAHRAAGAEHADRHLVAHRPQSGDHTDAVEPGHVHVQHERVGAGGDHSAQRGGPVVRGLDLETGQAEPPRQG